MRLYLHRFLLDPTAEGAGNGGGTQSPSPTPTVTPTPTAIPTVQMTVEEYQRLSGIGLQFAELQKANQLALDAKENERIKVLAEKGEIEKAIAEKDRIHGDKLSTETQRYADLERQVFTEKKAAVISLALAGRALAGADSASQQVTAQQLAMLLESTVEVIRGADGSLSVISKATRRPAQDVLREQLDSPTFAHFFAPRSQGGTGGGTGGNTPPKEKEGDKPKPGSVEEFQARVQAEREEYKSVGLFRIAQ